MDAGGRLLRKNRHLGGTDGVPIDLVVYPGVHHGFYYPELQPGRAMLGRWLEYNEDAAADASRRMRQFLDRYLD